MSLTYIKVCSFFAAFFFLQIEVMPWMAKNQFLPLWGDIILLSLALMLWLGLIDFVARTIRTRHDAF